jgi:hypothetical protein
MSEKFTSVVEEKNWRSILDDMAKDTGATPEHWNGEPLRDPEYLIKAFFIDPYWYVTTTDGTHRAISDDTVVTLADLMWCVGEQVRILATPPYGNQENV